MCKSSTFAGTLLISTVLLPDTSGSKISVEFSPYSCMFRAWILLNHYFVTMNIIEVTESFQFDKLKVL